MLFMRVQPGSCVREKFPKKVIPEAFGGEGPGRWNHMAGILRPEEACCGQGTKEGQCGQSTKKGRESGVGRDREVGRGHSGD